MKTILRSVILLLFCFNVSAQWTNNTALNTVVRDIPGNEEATPLMVTIADGSTYVTWFQQSATTNYELWMQRLDQNGVGLWGTTGLLISNFPQNTALFRYDLKSDNDGNAIVAFQDERTGHLDIVTYKVSPNGTMIWGANGIELTDPSSVEGLAPTIGVTASNDVVIAWVASGNPGKWIAFQKIYSAGGFAWANPLQIKDPNNTKRYSRATMVPAGTDDIVMLYAEETGSGLGVSKMLSQRFDNSGAPVWANPVTVSTYTIPFFYFHVAVSDHNGGFYAGFNTSLPSSPGTGVVYVQHVSANGVLWNSIGVSASQLPNSQLFSQQTLFDAVNNSVYVLIKATDPNQGQSGVYVQKLDTSGAAVWNANAVQLVPIQAAYNSPTSFSLTPTGVIVTYSIGGLTNLLLNAVKVDFAGTLQWSGQPVPLCSINLGKDDVSSGIFANNEVVVVWKDDRIGAGIYAQNIRDNGTLGGVTSITQQSENNLLNIYPNPSKNLNIVINEKNYSTAAIKITDMSGKTVLDQKLNNKTNSNHISVANDLTTGLYMVTLNVDDHYYRRLWLRE